MDAVCPNCGGLLKTKPTRKKKCPHCSKFIYVRQGRLIGEDQPSVSVAPAQTTKAKSKSNPFALLAGGLVALSLCCGILVIGGQSNQDKTSNLRSATAPTATTKPPTVARKLATATKKPPAATRTLLEPTNTPTPEPTFDDFADAPKLPTPTPTGAPLVTADQNVNLRSGPGTNYEVAGALSPGQSFDIIGRNADSSWWQILVDDKPAWVAASVVKAVNIDQEIEVIEAPPPPAPTTAPTIAAPTPSPTPILPPTFTPAPYSPAPPPPGGGCCKICSASKACGDSCISASKTCHKPPGCACNG